MMESKKKKKGSLSEDDSYLISQRYSPSMLLDIIKEINQFVEGKIDWNKLVKTTSTGITNPREYQMLWRHLAYREPLLENIDGTEPLDDDSDIEFELESVPPVSAEVASQAEEWAKIIIPSTPSRDSSPIKDLTGEAPSALGTSNGQTSNTPLDKEKLAQAASGKNITAASLHKRPLPTAPSTEGLDGSETAGSASAVKKKRKLWTDEEDTELINAVQKHGEGNWATILKGDFKHDRTASQLSQRWSTLKRRLSNSNPGTSSNSSSQSQSETLLATRKAVASALSMPMIGNFSAMYSGVTQPTAASSSSTLPSTLSDPSPAHPLAPNQLQQIPKSSATQKGVTIPSNKFQTTPKIPVPSMNSSVSIQATALAAGGRIAKPSDAASLRKAAEAAKYQNAYHFHSGSSSFLSASNKAKPKPTVFRPSRPYMMPPPPGGFGISSNGVKLGSLRPQGSSARLIGHCSSAVVALPTGISQGNAKGTNCKEISATVGEGSGSRTEEVGGDENKTDSSADGVKKEVADVGRNDGTAGKDNVAEAKS